MALLLVSTPERQAVWGPVLAAAGHRMIAGEAAVTDPAEVTAIACWTPPADLGRYPRLRAVISVGAGVDQMPPLPPGVALSRTLAQGLEAMVRDWVVMATLMLARDMPCYLDQARAGLWQPRPVRPASAVRVGILGLGRIGRLAAESLGALGFPVCGLSQSGDPVPGVRVFGPDGLLDLAAQSDVLVCLLPLTSRTRGLLSTEVFARMPAGAGLVHAGRGAQLDMAALRAALDSGRLAHAVLDVTDPEPLPPDHWAWSHPRLVVTPHVAAQTDPAEGARHALAVMEALREGGPIPGLVDPGRGY